eukprot:5837359-Amphidinium_carterae.1
MSYGRTSTSRHFISSSVAGGSAYVYAPFRNHSSRWSIGDKPKLHDNSNSCTTAPSTSSAANGR